MSVSSLIRRRLVAGFEPLGPWGGVGCAFVPLPVVQTPNPVGVLCEEAGRDATVQPPPALAAPSGHRFDPVGPNAGRPAIGFVGTGSV
jgi:hypothetical protein